MSENHVLLATSSPNTGGGSYTDVIFARDSDGKKLMNSVILGDPCDMCKGICSDYFRLLTGSIAGNSPESCTHKQDELASWKDPKKMERLRKLYHAVGGDDILRGELHTMAKESSSTLFPRHLYEDLLSSVPRPVDVIKDKIDAIYIGVDPAGGGKCEFALTAVGHIAAKKEFQVIPCILFLVVVCFFLFFVCNFGKSGGKDKIRSMWISVQRFSRIIITIILFRRLSGGRSCRTSGRIQSPSLRCRQLVFFRSSCLAKLRSSRLSREPSRSHYLHWSISDAIYRLLCALRR